MQRAQTKSADKERRQRAQTKSADKERRQRARTKKRKPKEIDLIKRAQHAVNDYRKLLERQRELEERLRSWCPQEVIDFRKRYLER